MNQVIHEGFGDHETRAWKGPGILTCKRKYVEHGRKSWRSNSNSWDERLDDKKSRDPDEQEKLAFACQSLPVVQPRYHEGSDDKGQCTIHVYFTYWKYSSVNKEKMRADFLDLINNSFMAKCIEQDAEDADKQEIIYVWVKS